MSIHIIQRLIIFSSMFSEKTLKFSTKIFKNAYFYQQKR